MLITLNLVTITVRGSLIPAKLCYGQCFGQSTTETTTQPATILTLPICDRFDKIGDFLDNVGSGKFLVAFRNDQDLFSRRPGQVTKGLKKRKIQFTRWIENIFTRINMHFKKKRFQKCFQNKVDSTEAISDSFDQCPLLNSRRGFLQIEQIPYARWYNFQRLPHD